MSPPTHAAQRHSAWSTRDSPVGSAGTVRRGAEHCRRDHWSSDSTSDRSHHRARDRRGVQRNHSSPTRERARRSFAVAAAKSDSQSWTFAGAWTVAGSIAQPRSATGPQSPADSLAPADTTATATTLATATTDATAVATTDAATATVASAQSPTSADHTAGSLSATRRGLRSIASGCPWASDRSAERTDH